MFQKSTTVSLIAAVVAVPVCMADVLSVGVYDESSTDENTVVAGIQNNAVDVSGTSDLNEQVSLTTFTTAVQTAFTENKGGVINFDNGLGANFGSSITATFGAAQAKSLMVTNGAGNAWTAITSTSRTGISHPTDGTDGTILSINGNTGTASGPDFVFNFSVSDRVVMVGGTLLSRSGATNQTAAARVVFSDSSTTSVSFTSSGTNKGGNDTFAGFEAPAGLFITQFQFDLPANEFRSVDDLGFITSDVVVPEVTFLDVARGYANTIVVSGRDRYGPQQTPLFAETLDRTTKNLLLTVPDMTGIRNHDRSPGGSNMFHMQQLLQLLYDLPRFTGDSSYAAEADAALLFFFQNLQSPVTGLMAWGEHIGWDFNTEQKISSPASGGFPAGYRDDTHEFFELWDLADRSFDLAPAALQTFAQGIWDHQIFSQQTGNFSRHAEYSVHMPEQGSEFPRHGGYFINLWAHAYDRSSDAAQRAVRLQSIAKIAENFSTRRHAVTRALPVGSGFDDFNNDYRNRHWPVSSLEMCIDVTDAAALLPTASASALTLLATELDDVFLQLPHLAGGLGFVTETPADNLTNIVDRSGTWITSYGETTDADIAVFCMNRYRQTNRMAFRTLAITAADRYLTSVPPGNITLYPGAFTGPITLLLEAHRLTGNLAYRTRAKFFGTMARDMFFTGTSGLPQASSQHNHYEAITGGDDLALVLLHLHEAITAPLAPTGLTAAPAANGGATLSWTDLSNYETGFAIERKQGAGAFVVIAGAVAANATTFTDTGLTAGATYSYRIRAFNAEGYSAYTAEVVHTPPISYLNIAKAYADRMLLSGRDTYGSQNSPLFASVLNRSTGVLLTSLPNMANIRNFDRNPGGSNVFHDQQLFQLLYDLPRFTGSTSYSQAADQALTFFYTQTQSPATGLLAWGEHICWDFNTEVPINRLDNPHGEDQHEFFEEWQLAAKSYQLAPAAAQGFAQGLWDHQIFNQTTGTFSRHARYSSHQPASGQEFPRHGGYYILTWAEAYDRSTDATQRATRLQSIDVLATSFLNRRHATTRAIPAGTGIDEYGKDYRNLHWLTNTIEMARTITRAADLVPTAQSTKLLELATSIDDVFLSLPHLNGVQGFIAETNVDNLSVIVARTSTWASGYGMSTDAGVALACLDRYDRTNRLAYRTLGLAAADRYLTSQPASNAEVHPGTFAEVITLMLDAHELTGNLAYRNRAEFFGAMAASTFFDGTSGLPRASSVHGHYETITGGDDLGYVLLRLHEAISPPLSPLNLAVSPLFNGQAALTWADPSQYEAGFKIERQQESGAYVELASIPGEDAVAITDSGLALGTTYTYRMRAFNSAGHSAYSNEVTLTTYTSIENWRLQYFNSPENQGTGADDFDADDDGMVNLLEYAFASHPKESGPSPVVSDLSGGHLRVAFPRHAGRSDLTYRVRASNEMNGWTTIASSTGGAVMTSSGALSVTESGSGELKNVLVVDSAVVGSVPKRFLRVEVTR